jgi:RNA polymerase sigma factor (sigma-70 family)
MPRHVSRTLRPSVPCQEKMTIRAMGAAVDPRSDRELMSAARTDEAAFEEIYRRHSAAVTRFAARRSQRPAEVVDLVGAIWLEVVTVLHRYDPSRGDPLPWILGIAANLCAAERRRERREHEILAKLGERRSLEDDDLARLEEMLDAESVAPDVLRAIDELPRSERLVAELVVLDELSTSEAAVALGISRAAASMRLARARRKLRAAIAGATDPLVMSVVKEVSP